MTRPPKVKRSLTLRASPIHEDGISFAHYPSDSDRRWTQVDTYSPWKWTGPWGYIVARVTNSTSIRPGFYLTRGKVDELIEEGWTVTVLSKI